MAINYTMVYDNTQLQNINVHGTTNDVHHFFIISLKWTMSADICWFLFCWTAWKIMCSIRIEFVFHREIFFPRIRRQICLSWNKTIYRLNLVMKTKTVVLFSSSLATHFWEMIFFCEKIDFILLFGSAHCIGKDAQNNKYFKLNLNWLYCLLYNTSAIVLPLKLC